MTRRLFIALAAFLGACVGRSQTATSEQEMCRVCGQWQIPEVIDEQVEYKFLACGNDDCGALRIKRIHEA